MKKKLKKLLAAWGLVREISLPPSDAKLALLYDTTTTQRKEGTVPEDLFISEERMKELVDACAEADRKYSTYTEAAAEVSLVCKHPNELFMVGWIFGSIYEKKSRFHTTMSM